MGNVIELLFGCCFVIIYAWGRYNTPDTNRSTTTGPQFYLVFTLYAFVLVIIYWLFTVFVQFSPDAFIKLMQAFGLGLEAFNIGQLNSPITTALIFSTLLPKVPLIGRLDKNILYFFWGLGEIPTYAMKLATRMNRSTFYIHPVMEDDLKHYARRYDLNSDSLVFNQEDSPEFLWSKACALILQIENWKRHENLRYRRFYQEYENQFEEIKGEFGAFSSRLASYIKRLSKADDDNVKGLQEDIHEHLMYDGRALVQRCCKFIAHAVLMGEISENGRAEALKRLGFEYIKVQNENLTPGQIIKLWLWIFVGFFTLSVFETLTQLEDGQSLPYEGIFFITLIMSVNYGVSAFAGIYPKTRWRFANIEFTRSRPYWGYVSSGLLATVISLLLIIALRFTKETFDGTSDYESVENVLRDLSWSYPYLFHSFVLAFVTAFVADNEPGQAQENLAAWRDAFAVMVIMILIALFSYAYMHGFAGFEGTKAERFRDATWQWGNVQYDVFKAAVVGLLVGYLVPHWYRNNKYRTPLDTVLRWIDRNQTELKFESARLNRGELVQALVNVNAAITIADGQIDEMEKDVVREVLNRLAEYKILDFRVDTTMRSFLEAITRYQTDNPNMEDIDLSALEPLRKQNNVLTELIARVCLAVGHADGVFEDKEAEIYSRILDKLDVDVSIPGAGTPVNAYVG